jgi:DNA-binding NarL/FixJ family response regulator
VGGARDVGQADGGRGRQPLLDTWRDRGQDDQFDEQGPDDRRDDGADRIPGERPEREDVKVLILTTFDLDDYVYAALRAGASGFLLKNTPPNDLLAGIRVVAAGDALLAPSVTRQLISEFVRRPDSDRPPPATLDVLTSREREVLRLVARGWSNAEIAERLYLSPATAKTHVGRLLTKLQARDRTQLVVIAYETGLVTPSGPAGLD